MKEDVDRDVLKIERELARLFVRVDRALPRIIRNCHEIMNLLIQLEILGGPSYMPQLSQGMVFFEWFTLYRYKGGRLYKARGDVPIDRAVHLDVTLTVYLMRHNPITLEVSLERTAEGVEPFKVELLEDTDFLHLEGYRDPPEILKRVRQRLRAINIHDLAQRLVQDLHERWRRGKRGAR